MPSNKFTKDFADYSAYDFPGQIVPEAFNHQLSGGEAEPGLQWMIHNAISAYGPRHIISGLEVQSGGTNSVTGTEGYYMWNGEIKHTEAISGTLAGDYYAYISGDGSLQTAAVAQFNSGLMLALSGSAGITNISQKWDANKILYKYVDKLYVEQITGNHANISFEQLSGTNFQATNITGDHADIGFESLSGTTITGTNALINNISTSIISGSQITGTDSVFTSLKSSTISGSQITGTSGLINRIINTTLTTTNGTITTLNSTIISGSYITGTSGIIDNMKTDVVKLQETEITDYQTGIASVYYSSGFLYFKDFYGNSFKINYMKGWDLSTAKYHSSYHITGEDSTPASVFFKPDGTSMYVCGDNNSRTYQYNLTTPWDITTASYSTYSSQFFWRGFCIRNDGKKLFEIQSTSYRLQYMNHSGTAWDVRAFYPPAGTNYKILSDVYPYGLYATQDGEKAYYAGTELGKIYQMTGTTGWYPDSFSEIGSLTVSSQDSQPSGVFLSPDGYKMYMAGGSNGRIYQYSLTTAWDITTASYDNVYISTSGAARGLFFSLDGLNMYVATVSGTIARYTLTPSN